MRVNWCPKTKCQRYGITGSRINDFFFVITSANNTGVENTIYQFMNDDFHDGNSKYICKIFKQIMSQRTRRDNIFFQSYCYGLRLKSSYDNRKFSLAIHLI